ncbi:MAG: flagellar hook-length control protein FliK [Lachnospiraceae bacterium]|nr:flagellar hook-length control protein FliK [Lachnospiraceae bacterium]
MRLSSYTNQINQTFVENMNSENTSTLEQGLKNGMDAVRGRLPGQSITGEVLMRDGSDILISLGENQLLQAKLEGSMSAQPGQFLTFQIKNNANSKIVLSPLFENLSQDPNVSKALQAAGLPETNLTAGMVKAMMQEGLPINKQSLYQMNRLINANPQVSMETLVQMQRMNLPITKETIFQFEAYKNYQHQLSESLSDIADAFTQSFQELTGSGELSQGISFYKNVLGILAESAGEAAGGDGTINTAEGEEQVIQNPAGQGDETAAVSDKNTPSQIKTQQPILPENELEGLVRALKNADAPDKIVGAVAQNRMSGQALLHEINKMLSEDAIPDKEKFFELLESREFKHVLKNEMNRQWLMLPEEVANEHSVDKLYERLNSQMNRLNQMLAQTAKADTPLAKAVANVTNNIDFMNQLNQTFTYVQIPLKMQGKEANGELFVYTNKKSLAKKDGSVSALLHLDMEYLGSLDVYVALNDRKVSTKFYLKDDAALDLIAQNIDLLNKRLEDRGYSVNAEFINRDEDTNMMDEMLKQNKNISVLAGYSFDARA